MKRLIIAAFLLLGLVSNGTADIFRPAYLELRELGDGQYAVLWKVPALGNEQRLSAYVQFPDGTETVSNPRVASNGGSWTERWEIRFPGGLIPPECLDRGVPRRRRREGITDPGVR